MRNRKSSRNSFCFQSLCYAMLCQYSIHRLDPLSYCEHMILSGAAEHLWHSRDTLRRDPIFKNKSIFRCDDSRKRLLACNKWRPLKRLARMLPKQQFNPDWTTFRSLKEERRLSLEALINRKDVFALLTTSLGKSLMELVELSYR